MVPAPELRQSDQTLPHPAALPVLTRRVRAALLLVVVGLVALFGVAAWLDPYGPNGQPLALGAHQQLGLPECNFRRLTGMPCPSCGMTTSFALLMHGDWTASLQANAVGTLLALFLLGLIPWCVVTAARGRWLWVRQIEVWVLRVVIAFSGLAILRWAVVLLLRKY